MGYEGWCPRDLCMTARGCFDHFMNTTTDEATRVSVGPDAGQGATGGNGHQQTPEDTAVTRVDAEVSGHLRNIWRLWVCVCIGVCRYVCICKCK